MSLGGKWTLQQTERFKTHRLLPGLPDSRPEQGGAVDPRALPVGLTGAGVGGRVPVRLQGAPRPLPHPHHQLADHVGQGVGRVVPQLDPLNNLPFETS